MSQKESKPDSTVDADAIADDAPPPWSRVWQLPALVGSFGVLVMALLILLNSRPTIDFPEMFEEVNRLIAAGEHEHALQVFEDIESHRAKMNGDHLAQFYLTRGELFYQAQMELQGQESFNLTEAVDAYRQAETHGAKLDSEQTYHLADALLRLERSAEVLPLIDRLPPSESAARQRLIKSLIDRNLAISHSDYTETANLLLRLTTEPELTPDDHVWSIARLAELRLRQGFVDDSIDKLLIDMQKLRAQGVRSFPELNVILGRAYIESGEYGPAEEQLREALAGLETSDPIRGLALLRMGHIVKQRRDWEEAKRLFEEVITSYPGTPAYLPALLGRAEVQAELGNRLDAMNDYSELVRAMAPLSEEDPQRRLIDRETITSSIIVWHDRFHEEGRLIEALRMAHIAAGQYPEISAIPEELLERLGQTNWDLGAQTMRDSWLSEGVALNDDGLPIVMDDALRVDPATRQQARTLFLNSAEYFTQLAGLLLEFQPDESALAIRKAALAYDRAGDYLAAAEAFKEHVRLSRGAPGELWGTFMLARSYQALQDYDGAIEQFRTLITDHRNSIEAHRSYVPLAQSLLNHPTSPNPAEAERVLRFIVEGSASLRPEAIEYADALIELGMLYSRADDFEMPRPAATYYPEAISRLTEALHRYPNDPRRDQIFYWLGHVYRLSAEALEAELAIERPEWERETLASQRTAHLGLAAENYSHAIEAFEATPLNKQSRNVKTQLKFARFWRADCAFDQGAYREAIALFTQVADAYADDAAGLVAIVQIVNAYAALGETAAARTAQARAWRILRDLPPEAFEASPLPLDRNAWERLLQSNRVLDPGVLSSVDP